MIAEPALVEVAPGFAEHEFLAFTTTRAVGSLGLGSGDAVGDVMGRWAALRGALAHRGIARLATAAQVHGRRVVPHGPGWSGWLRVDAADGHFALPGEPIALAVTIADCVPIFMTHPSGAAALLHSGWRGTEAGILDAGLEAFAHAGLPASELTVHLGPAICGRCYEVSPGVYRRLTGCTTPTPAPVDLRGLIAARARARSVLAVTVSSHCTRCDHARYFSHRAADTGRQVAVLARLPRALP